MKDHRRQGHAARPAACCAWTRDADSVYVEGLNIVKRHTSRARLRDTQRAQEIGGIVEREGPIHVSNVMLLDPDRASRPASRIKREGGRRVRVAKRSGKEID